MEPKGYPSVAPSKTAELAIPIKSPLRILLLTALTPVCANPAHSPIPIPNPNPPSHPVPKSRCNLNLNPNFRQTLTPSSTLMPVPNPNTSP